MSRTEPTADDLSVLSPIERLSFRVTHAMNASPFKEFWGHCQRSVGMGWIDVCTSNLRRIYGIENVLSIQRTRPILLVCNHRSFFDFYVVSMVVLEQTDFVKELYFPVRGRFFYESVSGMFVNLVMGFWSMYPPIFKDSEKRRFNDYANRRLIEICAAGPGTVIGIHPEGTRNQSPDPYSVLPAQPGVGHLIKNARPHVVPVFIAGLGNDLPKQVLSNWTGGVPIRVYFGQEIDLTEFYAMKNHVRTYKAIADHVMGKVVALAEIDRAQAATFARAG